MIIRKTKKRTLCYTNKNLIEFAILLIVILYVAYLYGKDVALNAN
ncbi:hypothetical protein LX74_02900 [Elizabethkingia miricola]|uniref:Uncharacterized protein n=1 Tax=Elizabethkingia miricola TaxID=172045 RepID=A0ABY3NDD4_ELIMR|nr:hypothetical protein LX74_02900 [Elizabethkingia miricola]